MTDTAPIPPVVCPEGWQPIASAPKDGRFLVYGGRWVGEVGSSDFDQEITLVSRYGPQFTVADTDYYSAWVEKPTHWMPLPPPPGDRP